MGETRGSIAVEPEEEKWFVRSGGMQSSRDRFAAVRMESDVGEVYGRRVWRIFGYDICMYVYEIRRQDKDL